MSYRKIHRSNMGAGVRPKFPYARKKTVFQKTTLKIGEISKKSGVPIVTLRFYENEGLIRPVRNPAKDSTHRRYYSSVYAELEFIKLCRASGFSLPEIRSMLKIYRGFKPPAKLMMNSIYRTIDQIRTRMKSLNELERILVLRLQNPAEDIAALIDEDPEIFRLRGMASKSR